MVKVYIWGIGAKRVVVENAINKQECQIIGYIDNNPQKQGTFLNGILVSPFSNTLKEYDYIIISVQNYESILYQLETQGYDMDKLIVYFRENEYVKAIRFSFIDSKAWHIDLLEEKIKKLERTITCAIRNQKYEMLDAYKYNKLRLPEIGSTEEAINKIVDEKCSLVRFGDGEFEIMAGKERAVFQKYDPILANRMKQIIRSKDPKLLIAIADNYGCLDKYTEEVADDIRCYMTEEVRKFHLSVLDLEKKYYDAYMFKCYWPYKDKENTQTRVERITEIWRGRDVVLIEGDKTRTGFGNDLLDKANSVRRILAPTKNAFDKYGEILSEALKLPKNVLILVTLGPAGKLLAYDLFSVGFQVVDIGQIDMDYDWYKAKARTRIANPKKYVSQLPEAAVDEISDASYLKQIICRIM